MRKLWIKNVYVIERKERMRTVIDYTPSQTVKDISTRIVEKTSYTNWYIIKSF